MITKKEDKRRLFENVRVLVASIVLTDVLPKLQEMRKNKYDSAANTLYS
jgi:hypothetical protein